MTQEQLQKANEIVNAKELASISLDKIKSLFENCEYPRFPVYQEEIDNFLKSVEKRYNGISESSDKELAEL